MTWLAVAIGGAVGSLARHAVNVGTNAITAGRALPYATAVVNLIGCGAIGVLAALVATGRVPMTPTMRAFLFVGVLGGFTTFSAFGLDTFTLVREGRTAVAIANGVAQVAGGIAAVVAGYAIGARL